MYKSVTITVGHNESNTEYSVSWNEGECTIEHTYGSVSATAVLDSSNRVVIVPTTIEDGRVILDFGGTGEEGSSFTLNLIGLGTSDEIDGEYYSGGAENIMMFCRSLDISEDRLATVSVPQVERYQRLVDDAIDGYIVEYYFIPLMHYNQVMPDGRVRKVFPGKIRLLAIQWVAGLLMQSQFQSLEPNMNEQAQRFIEESKKEMQHIVDFSTRIPGQRRKFPSPTMPPNLAPSKTNELQL